MPNNEINVNIEVDERKGAVAPLTAATDTFQPISPVTESADNVENLLGQGQQIISNIPVVGAMYSKGSSLISQAQNIGTMFATANVMGIIGLGIAAVTTITEKTVDYIQMKRQAGEIQRRAGLNRGQ